MRAIAGKESQNTGRSVAASCSQSNCGAGTFQFVNKSVPPIQMQTKVTYGPLKPMKAGHHNIQVGTKVEAQLDPAKPIKGSSTAGFKGWGTSFISDMKKLTNESWVAGHLINHDLGGRGVIHNFFPITKKANSVHLFEVEYPVKGWLMDGHEVNYKVNAFKKNGATSPNPSGVFDCTAEVTKPNPFKKKPSGKIHKQVHSDTVKFEGEIAGIAEYDDNEVNDRRRKGVPSTWKHLAGSKYDRQLEKKYGQGGWYEWSDDMKFSFDGVEHGKYEDLNDEHESPFV